MKTVLISLLAAASLSTYAAPVGEPAGGALPSASATNPSTDAGFKDGWIVGKADASENRARDGAKAMRLGKMHSQSHTGDKAAYASGYLLGYNEGWHARRKVMGF
jgi:hypothetical protein